MATKKTTTNLSAQAGESKTESIVKKTAKFIISPRVTEKASSQSLANAYTFVVTKDATKLDIINEIKKEHKVSPLAVNITNTPSQRTFVRGKWGTKSGLKKAVVFLKKGDSIKLS